MGGGGGGGGGGSTTAVVLQELQSVNCIPLNRGRYWSVTKRISDECMYCYVHMNDIAWRPSVYLKIRVYFTISGWFLSPWVCVYFRVILEKESIPPPPMPPPPEEGFVVYVSKQKKNLGKLLCIDLFVFPFVLYVKGWLYDGTSRLEVSSNKRATVPQFYLFRWYQRETVGAASFFSHCPLTRRKWRRKRKWHVS